MSIPGRLGGTPRLKRCAFSVASVLCQLKRESFGGRAPAQLRRPQKQAHLLKRTTDEAFIFSFEQQRHELLSQVESIIEKQHQQSVGHGIGKLCAVTNPTLALSPRQYDSAFTTAFELVINSSELRQESLKLMTVHAGDREK
jgi:hypothetical protein